MGVDHDADVLEIEDSAHLWQRGQFDRLVLD
jgi:hypothetical protein